MKNSIQPFSKSSAFFNLLARYLRLSVTGIENIPNDRPTIFISNHSGFSGLDALLLRYLIYQRSRWYPRILLHKLWYRSRATRNLAQKLGFIEATYASGISELRSGQSVLLFPEGAHGNFKPYSQKYQLQEFKSGFVRMAMDSRCPISPVLILGPEESHINLRKIDLSFLFKDTALPLPLNFWPLPVKWRVHFLEPIELPEKLRGPVGRETIGIYVKNIQKLLQRKIEENLEARGNPYI